MVTCFQNRLALLSVHLSSLFLLFIPLTFSAFWLLPTAFSEDDNWPPKTTYHKQEPNILKEKSSFLAFSQGVSDPELAAPHTRTRVSGFRTVFTKAPSSKNVCHVMGETISCPQGPPGNHLLLGGWLIDSFLLCFSDAWNRTPSNPSLLEPSPSTRN